MLVAAAVCPHPPLLVPEAMGGAARAPGPQAGCEARGPAGSDPGPHAGSDPGPQAGCEAAPQAGCERGAQAGSEPGPESPQAAIGRLRTECQAAVAEILAARPDLVVVVGGADRTASYPGSAAGSLGGYGIPFVTGRGAPVLPLSLTIGAWLLRDLPGLAPRVRLQAVCQSLPAAACLQLGALLAREAPAAGLLIMGDGPARRATGVHGAADPAADAYDAAVAAALAAADPAGLASLDARLDAELMVAGRAAWQVLAGAAGGRWMHGRLRYAAAPLDVSYVVATWTAAAAVRPGAGASGREC